MPDRGQDTANRPATKRPPSPAALAVWEIEDGRCEACSRPMDRTCARTGRDSRGEHRLVCPDCKERKADPLTAAVVGPRTAGQIAGVLGTTLEAASAWLAAGLRAYGVLLRLQADRRVYWLPGVGCFSLLLEHGPLPMIGGPLGRLDPIPEIRIKPQARTRGLPRLHRLSEATASSVAPAHG